MTTRQIAMFVVSTLALTIVGCDRDEMADLPIPMCTPVLAGSMPFENQDVRYQYLPGYVEIEPLNPPPPNQVSVKESTATLLRGRMHAATYPGCAPIVKLMGASIGVRNSANQIFNPRVEVLVNGATRGEIGYGGSGPNGSQVQSLASGSWVLYPDGLGLGGAWFPFEVVITNWNEVKPGEFASIKFGGDVTIEVNDVSYSIFLHELSYTVEAVE